jgi:nucleotide sugar dehydrogenase
VAGLTEGCLKQTAAFFARFGSVHPTRGLREAEAAKLLENTYRLVNIGLFNEFTRACLSLGVDSGEAIAAAATKPYGFAAFEPGLGAGGHCVPVDPLYLIRTTGAAGGQLPISRAAVEVNKTVPGWMAERICLELGKLAGASVLLLGVSYKPDCADMRNSPAIRLAELLQAQGVRLFYHDPYVPILHLPHTGMLPVPDLPAALATADLTVLATRHRCYTPELLAAARRLFDTRAATSGAWPVSKAAER